MKDKSKLIAALRAAANRLADGTINYAWTEQERCNCGVVAQAVLGLSMKQLRDRLANERVFNRMDLGVAQGISKEDIDKLRKVDTSWTSATKAFCPITGSPMRQIFRDLMDAGMEPKDFRELEYLSNPAVVTRADISTKPIETTVTKEVKSFFGLIKETKSEVEKSGYWTDKSNLVRYLVAWADLLEEQQKANSNKIDSVPFSDRNVGALKAKMNKAIEVQDYEEAARLRDLIQKIAG